MPTRFASLSPLAARLILAALALIVAIGLASAFAPAAGPKLAPAGRSDAALYRAIAAQSDTLDHYYTAATAAQRARGYPLRPFVTVREPALASLSNRLGETGTTIVFRLLALGLLGALVWRLRAVPSPPARIGGIALAAGSVLLLAQPALAVWHEAWGGLLLALALLVRGERRWAGACLIGLVALLVRELALPAIVALAVTAIAERRLREAAGWSIILILFGIALAGHAAMVSAHLLPGDPASPGWTQFGGWGFVLAAAHGTSLFLLLPLPLVAVAVPLALLGWAATAQPWSDRAAAALVATLLPFMLVGRSDNFYWGLMVAPLLPVGLAFAPAALVTLARQAAGKSPSVPTWQPGSASS